MRKLDDIVMMICITVLVVLCAGKNDLLDSIIRLVDRIMQ